MRARAPHHTSHGAGLTTQVPGPTAVLPAGQLSAWFLHQGPSGGGPGRGGAASSPEGLSAWSPRNRDITCHCLVQYLHCPGRTAAGSATIRRSDAAAPARQSTASAPRSLGARQRVPTRQLSPDCSAPSWGARLSELPLLTLAPGPVLSPALTTRRAATGRIVTRCVCCGEINPEYSLDCEHSSTLPRLSTPDVRITVQAERRKQTMQSIHYSIRSVGR
jgi:hypothetical protein